MQDVSNQLLDRIAARTGNGTSYGLAKLFGAGDSLIRNYRKGRSRMDEDTAIHAAKLAGENPAAVLAELQAERAKSPEAKKHWLRLASLARAAA